MFVLAGHFPDPSLLSAYPGRWNVLAQTEAFFNEKRQIYLSAFLNFTTKNQMSALSHHRVRN